MKIKLSRGKSVSDFGKPYIIAELAANHNGDMAIAERMIREAKSAGADAVKFQSWSKGSLFSRAIFQGPDAGALEQDVERYATSFDELSAMKKLCDILKIDFICTPFCREELDFLVKKLKVTCLKIASMDVNNFDLLEYCAATGLPIILSTGLSTLADVDAAVRCIEAAGNRNIVILHCVSLYPPADSEVNLNRMDGLRAAFEYPVGFSDHTVGFSIPLAAIAKGACVIEKHFTLDKSMAGWDHAVSCDPADLRVMVKEGERIWKALGSRRIRVSEGDAKVKAFRRSVVAACAIGKGSSISKEMLAFKRPGSGLEPAAARFIIGKAARRAIKADEQITLSDF